MGTDGEADFKGPGFIGDNGVNFHFGITDGVQLVIFKTGGDDFAQDMVEGVIGDFLGIKIFFDQRKRCLAFTETLDGNAFGQVGEAVLAVSGDNFNRNGDFDDGSVLFAT